MTTRFIREARLVHLGGGTGTCCIAKANNDIGQYRFMTIIVTAADEGGDSKRYRKRLGHIAWGDVRRAGLTLGEDDEFKEHMGYRFDSRIPEQEEHNIGNAFLASKYEILRRKGMNHDEAVVETVRYFCKKAGVLPGRQALVASTTPSHLEVFLNDGFKIADEGELDRYVYDGRKITRARLNPVAKIHPLSKEKIEEADIIIIGPGSWFGSVIATLAVDGVAEAIYKARTRSVKPAKLVCVVNLFTSAEDHGFPLSELLRFGDGHLGGQGIDACVFNNRVPSREVLDAYHKKGSYLVNYDKRSLDYCDKVIHFPCLEIDNKGRARHSSSIANVFTNLDEILDYADDEVFVDEGGSVLKHREKVLL